GADLATPFPRLTYGESMRRYGSDKPDTRYGMELVDVTEAFRASGFRAFASAVAAGGIVKGFAAPAAASWSRKDLDALVQEATSRGAAGLVWIVFDGPEARSPVIAHLSPGGLRAVADATGAGHGDVVVRVADRAARAHG